MSDAIRPRLAPTIAVGVGAGFFSGLFGVGGGILVVPALVMVLALKQRLAHGTSLAAIVPIALAGVVGFTLDGSVDWPVALALAVGAAGGAAIGTRLLHRLPSHVLVLAFSGLLLATAIRMITDTAEATGRAELDVLMVLALLVLGFFSGVIAGLLGVGGGIVMVPGQVLLFGIPAAVAKGTSLAVIIPTAIVGTASNLRRDNVTLPVAAVVGLSGVASSFVASRISLGLSERTSNLLFAPLAVVVAARMLIGLARSNARARAR